MGYESKLYVVEKSREFDSDGTRYADIVATVDLCKCYAFSGWMRNCQKTDCYIYADDGDKRITEDCYGEPLKEASVEDVLAHLVKANGADEYRRYKIAIGIMQAFVDNRADFNDIAVLHYGY